MFSKVFAGKKGSPMRFLVTEDGKIYSGGIVLILNVKLEEIHKRLKMLRKTWSFCHTFAVGRSIKWDNGVDKKALKIKFTSKDTIQEIKDKLTKLGFYGDGTMDSATIKTDTKTRNNITERLQTLSNMYKKGLLTEEEFKKAKQKLLN